MQKCWSEVCLAPIFCGKIPKKHLFRWRSSKGRRSVGGEAAKGNLARHFDRSLRGRIQRNICFVGGVQRGGAPLAAKRRKAITRGLSTVRCREESKETGRFRGGESKGDGVPVAHDLACKV